MAAGRVFDAHLHVIDPRFPLVENDGYLPPTFTVADYRDRIAALGITGGAVVSGSFQAFDQHYLVPGEPRVLARAEIRPSSVWARTPYLLSACRDVVALKGVGSAD